MLCTNQCKLNAIQYNIIDIWSLAIVEEQLNEAENISVTEKHLKASIWCGVVHHLSARAAR